MFQLTHYYIGKQFSDNPYYLVGNLVPDLFHYFENGVKYISLHHPDPTYLKEVNPQLYEGIKNHLIVDELSHFKYKGKDIGYVDQMIKIILPDVKKIHKRFSAHKQEMLAHNYIEFAYGYILAQKNPEIVDEIHDLIYGKEFKEVMKLISTNYKNKIHKRIFSKIFITFLKKYAHDWDKQTFVQLLSRIFSIYTLRPMSKRKMTVVFDKSIEVVESTYEEFLKESIAAVKEETK